jgi:tetratricopeptide (TPR) repeat protein
LAYGVIFGLWEVLLPRASGGAYFTTEDNRAFLQDLLATGRFCRDTPGGGLLHPGKVSVREIATGAGLHLCLDENNRIYVHVDSVCPAAGLTPDGTCRYDHVRSLAHMRREVFPLVMRSYNARSSEAKSARRARLDLYAAQRAWCEAVQASRVEESLEAGVRLAGFLAAEDESARERAQRLYQQAIDSGHEEFAPAAAFGLGILLEESEESARAQEAYEQAVASGHAEFAPWAAYNLAVLFERLGDLDRAEEAYERAIAFGHPQVTSWAALKLGDLLAGREDHDRAQDIYEQVISLRHPEFASRAALNLARLLEDLEEHDRARQAYEQVIALGPPEAAGTAADKLHALLEKKGGVETREYE